MGFEENFPFSVYRKYQREVLKQVENSFNGGKDTFILEAPPGFGKSAVNVAVAKSFDSAYIVTTQKVLQDIYGEYGLPVIKGRNNYKCLVTGNGADVGPCTIIKKYRCEYANECPYRVAKQECVESKVCVMNMAYAMIMPYPFEKRGLLVVDEAHNVDSLMLEFASVSINKRLLMEDVPTFKSIEGYAGYLLDSVEEIKKMIKREFEKYEKDKNELYVRSIKRMQKLIDKIVAFNADVCGGNKWTVERSKWNIKFTPVTVGRFAQDVLWWKGDKILCSSATFLDGKLFKEEVGIDGKVGFISVPSSFPKQNRPIYFLPVGLMSYKKKAETMPFMADMIGRICNKYPGENVIVHTNSYENAKILNEIITTKKDIILQEQEERESGLRMFSKGSNKLFLSVKMTEGIDLVGDKCRVNIISKIAFPSVADKRVKERMQMEDNWYNWKTVIELLQAIGRTTRSDVDKSDTYILDSNFGFLHSKNKTLFPKWFEEAIKWDTKPLKVYDKKKVLTEINKSIKKMTEEFGDVYLEEIVKDTGYSKVIVLDSFGLLKDMEKLVIVNEKVVKSIDY